MEIDRELELMREPCQVFTWAAEGLADFTLRVPRTVYPPREDTTLLDRALAALGPGRGRRLLEIGCGSGAVSIAAAMRGWRVNLCDIHPWAVATALGNAADLGLGASIEGSEGGPGDPVEQWSRGRGYDAIFWNLPYLDPPEPDESVLGPLEEAGLVDAIGQGEDRATWQHLIEAVEQHPDLLLPGGVIVLVHSDNQNGREMALSWRHAGFATRTVQHMPLGPEELRATAIWRPWEGREHLQFDSIDSTNAYILASDLPAGTWVTTDEQTAGRGQRGRAWRSIPGAFQGSLTLTRNSIEKGAQEIQLGAGLAILDVVATLLELPLPSQHWSHTGHLAHLGILPKWPNDIWLEGSDGQARKAVGMLVEGRSQGREVRGALGIGVNLHSPRAHEDVASLTEVPGLEWLDAEIFAGHLAVATASCLEDHPVIGPAPSVRDRIWAAMRTTAESTPPKSIDGEFVDWVGLTEEGDLMYRSQAKIGVASGTDELVWEGLHSASSS